MGASVQYVRLGSVDSGTEEERAIAEVEAGHFSGKLLADYAETLQWLNRKGLDAVAAMWIKTEEPQVVVYTGRTQAEEPTRAGGLRIWAAIELSSDRRVQCLLKITCDYTGDPRQFGDYMIDTLDRYRKGTRYTL